jgi:DNA-binding transcriptional LysR family regulator
MIMRTFDMRWSPCSGKWTIRHQAIVILKVGHQDSYSSGEWMDLNLLATFLEIYRTGSISTAASVRGISQPAASGHLARLEQHVGTALFVRTPRGVLPTERADALARLAGPHLDRLAHALDVGAPPPSGVVRIGGAAEVMTLRVLPALAPLTGAGLRVHATFGLAADLITALADDDLDLVVSAIRPTTRAVVAVPFVDEQFVLVGSPMHANGIDAVELATRPVRALSRMPLVAYAEDLPIVRRYWRSEFGRRPTNDVVMIAPDLRAVLAAVVAGVGVSVLPRYLAEPAIAAGSVKELHTPTVEPLNTLYLVTSAQRPPAPATTTLRDHLMEMARRWDSL